MTGENRIASLMYGLGRLTAVCAAIVSAIIASTALLWLVAGALDGRWQAVASLVALFSLAAVQIWLFFAALKRRDAGQTLVGTLCLLGSTVPTIVFLYVVSL